MIDDTPRERLESVRDHLVAVHARISHAVTELDEVLDTTENTDRDSSGFTIPCISCSHRFDPSSVPHVIIGPGSARYTCPECKTTVRGPPPIPDTDEE